LTETPFAAILGFVGQVNRSGTSTAPIHEIGAVFCARWDKYKYTNQSQECDLAHRVKEYS
jgi:hypothetical protein